MERWDVPFAQNYIPFSLPKVQKLKISLKSIGLMVEIFKAAFLSYLTFDIPHRHLKGDWCSEGTHSLEMRLLLSI